MAQALALGADLHPSAWSLTSCPQTLPLHILPPLSPFQVDYPWSKKANKAFARVGLYAAMAHNCSRVIVHKLSTTPEGKQWLDYGIYKNKHWKARHIKTVS